VTTNHGIRLLSFGLLVGAAASACGAQQAPAPLISARPADSTANAPQPSAPLAEMPPPKAPRVSCAGGQLRISADNSTLGGVLSAVRDCTGAQIDIPEIASRTRTFEDLGPGPERQVLEALLSGTDLNFVIESSQANPQKIKSVILMARTDNASNTSPAATDHLLTPARRAWMQSRLNGRPSAAARDENRQDTDSPSDAQSADDAATAPAETSSANEAPAAHSDTPPTSPEAPSPSLSSVAAPAATASEPLSGGNPALSQDKSTAERISDMQQMFQQRRQINQTQSQSPASQQP